MIKWHYSLTFASPLSIFSGLGVAGLVDRMVVRDHQGLPYVPGSTVKGRWRFFAERILRSGIPDDIAGQVGLHAESRPLCKRRDNACTICKFFGNPALPSLLWVGPANLLPDSAKAMADLLRENSNPVVHPDTEIRPGVAISRSRRTALPDHLFFDEAVPPLSFSGIIRCNGPVAPEEQRFLLAAAGMIDRLGGRKAVGRGSLIDGMQIGGGA